ncbi:MAG: EcsC family protein, partial [Chitinophagaceae bacterium]
MQYEEIVTNELKAWQRKMVSKPTALNKLSKRIQVKMNSYIPEKVHRAITVAIKQMIRGVLFGAKYITPEISAETNDLQQMEEKVLKRINAYKHAAAAEGGITGAGG